MIGMWRRFPFMAIDLKDFRLLLKLKERECKNRNMILYKQWSWWRRDWSRARVMRLRNWWGRTGWTSIGWVFKQVWMQSISFSRVNIIATMWLTLSSRTWQRWWRTPTSRGRRRIHGWIATASRIKRILRCQRSIQSKLKATRKRSKTSMSLPRRRPWDQSSASYERTWWGTACTRIWRSSMPKSFLQ